MSAIIAGSGLVSMIVVFATCRRHTTLLPRNSDSWKPKKTPTINGTSCLRLGSFSFLPRNFRSARGVPPFDSRSSSCNRCERKKERCIRGNLQVEVKETMHH